jgi:hypothetical protein
MAKITTADCKKFLVAEITRNPAIIHDIYQDKTTAINEALVAKNWVRISKCKADAEDGDVGTYDGLQIDPSTVQAVRRFVLDPATFDSAVVFCVIEDKKGNLILGEYVGD